MAPAVGMPMVVATTASSRCRRSVALILGAVLVSVVSVTVTMIVIVPVAVAVVVVIVLVSHPDISVNVRSRLHSGLVRITLRRRLGFMRGVWALAGVVGHDCTSAAR